MKRAQLAIFFIATLVVTLSGCASLRGFDSDVSTFYQWSAAPPGPGTRYRFERLPSQRAPDTQADSLEAAARQALAKVGLQEDSAHAQFSVQVTLNTQLERPVSDWPGGDGYGMSPRRMFLNGGSAGGLGFGFALRFPDTSYRHEVSLLIRDLGTHQVVFETRAASENGQNSALTSPVLPGLLDAALSGFPQPPTGPRRLRTGVAPSNTP